MSLDGGRKTEGTNANTRKICTHTVLHTERPWPRMEPQTFFLSGNSAAHPLVHFAEKKPISVCCITNILINDSIGVDNGKILKRIITTED